MRDERISVKHAVNDAIRAGLEVETGRAPYHTRPAPMGVPSVSLDRALQLATELEDEEHVRTT